MTEPVDLTELREITGGDTELEHELFQEFFTSSAECIAVLTSHCIDGGCEPFRSNAHSLKGMAMNLGAEKLGSLSSNAQINHELSAAEKEKMCTEIEAEYAKVKEYLQNIMN